MRVASNGTYFLKKFAAASRAAAPEPTRDDPETTLLAALRQGLVPLQNAAAIQGRPAKEAVAVIEALRVRGRVDLVERADLPDRPKFLRALWPSNRAAPGCRRRQCDVRGGSIPSPNVTLVFHELSVVLPDPSFSWK